MSVRRATEADGAAIAAVHCRTRRTTYRGVVSDEILDGLDVAAAGVRWAAAAAEPAPDRAIFVYEEDGSVVAFASLAPVEYEPGVGELETLYVDPDHQRRGIGSKLLRAATETLATMRCAGALLWVAEASEGARAFYELHGWTVDGGVGEWHGARTLRYRRSL